MYVIHYWTYGRNVEGAYEEHTIDLTFDTMADAIDWAVAHSLIFDDAVAIQIVKVGFEGAEGRLLL